MRKDILPDIGNMLEVIRKLNIWKFYTKKKYWGFLTWYFCSYRGCTGDVDVAAWSAEDSVLCSSLRGPRCGCTRRCYSLLVPLGKDPGEWRRFLICTSSFRQERRQKWNPPTSETFEIFISVEKWFSNFFTTKISYFIRTIPLPIRFFFFFFLERGKSTLSMPMVLFLVKVRLPKKVEDILLRNLNGFNCFKL